jgi:hypothetical protein
MRIDSNGNVRIGTGGLTNTHSKLDVIGGPYAFLALQATDTGGRRYELFSYATTESFHIYDRTNDQYRFTIDETGNVGIGTDSPDYKLSLRDDSTSAYPLSLENNNIGTVGVHTGIRFGYTGNTYQKGAIIFESQDANGRGKMYFAMEGTANSSNADETDAKMTIDYDGNVGIGLDPVYKLDVRGDRIRLNPNSNGFVTSEIQNTTGSFYFGIDNSIGTGFGGANSGRCIFSLGDYPMAFYTNSTERMRITSGGDVLFGTQGLPNGTSIYGSAFHKSTVDRMILRLASSTTVAAGLIDFFNPNGQVGYIATNGSATQYVTSSDYRLKENVVELTGALDRVSQLKPSRFNFIADADKTVDGFLAHEVQEIVPEAITGEKDGMRTEEYEVTPAVYEDVVHPVEEAVYETVEHPAVEEELDDEGNVVVEAVEAYTEEVLVTEAKEEWTEKVLVSEKVMGTREVPDYQGIDQSKLVPLLVGAIQEQQQLINDLKNRIETLENN